MYSVVWRQGRGPVAVVTPGNPLPSGFRCTNWAGISGIKKKKNWLEARSQGLGRKRGQRNIATAYTQLIFIMRQIK